MGKAVFPAKLRIFGNPQSVIRKQLHCLYGNFLRKLSESAVEFAVHIYTGDKRHANNRLRNGCGTLKVFKDESIILARVFFVLCAVYELHVKIHALCLFRYFHERFSLRIAAGLYHHADIFLGKAVHKRRNELSVCGDLTSREGNAAL